ncbi:hypothetical protein [Brevibacillus nitrificans]|uniref:hypothetical protein n=1 Tax=Brevibacillus nitrificans TaxID=651560 RepID=UPI00285C3B83|nr:hypothetical protein [Brevibacillus nitrificans]MDR7317552.1 hypothetical protein [Brevibacillus nitrificans]
MVKAVFGALLYLAVVFGGYAFYESYLAENQQVVAVEQLHAEGGHENGKEGHGNDAHESGEHGHGDRSSEVSTYVQSDHDGITIYLKDKVGNPVDELMVNHEKLLHFIIVDEHLEKYYHVHPEKIGKGKFRIGNILPDGFYKAFIDIKPKQLAYSVDPVPFVVGNPVVSTVNKELMPDDQLIQTAEGETVKLNMSSFRTNEPVTLKFDLDRTQLTPYLGAMGHVVILDENAQNYLHVHPSNESDPIFETQFSNPGLYKIWAEFMQNGKVRTFSYVVEIVEEK